jgi:hypothetical protein
MIDVLSGIQASSGVSSFLGLTSIHGGLEFFIGQVKQIWRPWTLNRRSRIYRKHNSWGQNVDDFRESPDD